MKVLLRIAQSDLVESIKNTNTEACSDDLSSERLSSFIFKAIKMHCSGFQFSFAGQIICSSFFSIQSNVNVCFRGLITRFGAAPPNLQ